MNHSKEKRRNSGTYLVAVLAALLGAVAATLFTTACGDGLGFSYNEGREGQDWHEEGRHAEEHVK